MRKLLVLVVALAPVLGAQEVSMTCASSSVQTQEVTGPGGVTVVMKVSGTDDYSKNTHDCMAKFQLLMQAVSNGPVKTVDVMVIEPDSTDKCQSNFHWVVTSAAGALKLLPKGKEITGLYHGE